MPSVVLTQIISTKKNGISFFRLNRHLIQDSNIVRLKLYRIVRDHNGDVTAFICMPRTLPVWCYEVPGLQG